MNAVTVQEVLRRSVETKLSGGALITLLMLTFPIIEKLKAVHI